MEQDNTKTKDKIRKLAEDFGKKAKVNEDRIVNEDLTPEQIIEIYREQRELQDCHFWMKGILNNRFPEKVIQNGTIKMPRVRN